MIWLIFKSLSEARSKQSQRDCPVPGDGSSVPTEQRPLQRLPSLRLFITAKRSRAHAATFRPFASFFQGQVRGLSLPAQSRGLLLHRVALAINVKLEREDRQESTHSYVADHLIDARQGQPQTKNEKGVSNPCITDVLGSRLLLCTIQLRKPASRQHAVRRNTACVVVEWDIGALRPARGPRHAR